MNVKTGVRCLVEGCNEISIAKNLCSTHYKRYKRHGDVKQTRAEDWGKRDKHPLYVIWKGVKRWHGANVCVEWGDFWKFASDVGEKPNVPVRFQIIDSSKPVGPGNFFWQKLDLTAETAIKRAKNVEYQKAYRAMHINKIKNKELKKRYGITLEQWQAMYDEQHGVCKICGQPETKIDRRQGVVRKLSVDHCHDTNKVRGLLCSDCNTAIGLFKHDPELLERAIKYCKKD